RLAGDLRVVVLEREIAGFGPSGRNGGWASARIAGSWSVYAGRHGPDAVLRAERETYRTVDEIGEVVEREGIDCGFSKGGMLTIATSAPQAERVRADLAAARAHRLPEEDFRQLEEGELEQLVRLSRCRLAAYSPHCARIDPARLVR